MTTNWKLPALRESTYPTPDDLTARREGIAALEPPPPAPGVEVTDETFGGVACIVSSPPEARRTVVYFHGGGYRLGSPEASVAFTTRMAAATAARVVAVRYRLAPEHPYPAAVADATAAYEAVLAGASHPVVAAGDSAGGGLAAALAVACKDAGMALPAALVLMSPWADMTATAATYQSKAGTDQLFSLDSATEAGAMYLQGHDQTDPLASPVFADMAGFPPTLVFASADEVLLGDALALVSRLAEAGVEVHSVLRPGVAHAWPAVFPTETASAEALVQTARFLDDL